MQLLGVGIRSPRDSRLDVWKQNKGIRIRESLKKLRCQRPDNFSDSYDDNNDRYDRPGGGGIVSLGGSTGSWVAPEAAHDDGSEIFSNRYDITIMQTHKAPPGDQNDRPVYPLLPPKQCNEADRHINDRSTSSDEATASLDDSLLTDWETVAGVFPRVDDIISQGGEETLGYDEYSTVPSVSTRHYYTNGVVDEVVDVFDDFTYFFRCLKVEAQNQLVEASSSMHCGG